MYRLISIAIMALLVATAGAAEPQKTYSLRRFVTMFEATSADGVVRATLYGEQDGSLASFGNVAGRSGKITDEPWHDCVALSFGPF